MTGGHLRLGFLGEDLAQLREGHVASDFRREGLSTPLRPSFGTDLGGIDSASHVQSNLFHRFRRASHPGPGKLQRGLVGPIKEEGMGFDIKAGMQGDLLRHGFGPGRVDRDDLLGKGGQAVALNRLLDRLAATPIGAVLGRSSG